MIDDLNNKYAEFKGVIDILPVNTKYNRKRKIDYITDEEKDDNALLDAVKNEINKRLSDLNALKENEKIQLLRDELEKCNIVNEWNNYNTAYEKMHLDYYLYQLHRYYKEDLESVNACLNKIIESFKKVEINLTKNDFDFNEYAALYMDRVINNVSSDELKKFFEEIYWKNSDVIRTIEINFKSIYLKYEKKITKYYELRHQEFLKSHNDNEIYKMRVTLSNQLKELIGTDPYINFQKFVNHEYSLKDFAEGEMQKKKDLYFSDNSYSFDNLMKLDASLEEYEMLIKYNYLLADMRSRLEKKEEFKNVKDNALKDINKDESSLKKLISKHNAKPFLFFKKKTDEKWLFDYNSVIEGLSTKFDAFDDIRFNELVLNKLSKDCNVYDVLRFVSSNYLYFVEQTKKSLEIDDINVINEKFKTLKEEIYDKDNYALINNLALLDEKQIKQIIVDKYNLENINLSTEILQKDNMDKTLNDINSLIDYEYFLISGINLDDVDLYMEYQKLIKE
mgnify:CR=1 FL=1